MTSSASWWVMRSDGLKKATLLVAALGLLAGCADFARGRPSPDDGVEEPVGGQDAGPDGAPSFASDIHPLLMSRCHSCHSSGGGASSTGYVLSGGADSDYALTVRFIDESAPAQSRLVSKASGVGHGGGALFPAGSDEHGLLVQWIAQGALP